MQQARYNVHSVYNVHTVHSSVTQMLVNFVFLPTKNALDKQRAIRDIWSVQASCDDAVITRYVATDNPVVDLNMVRSLHAQVFVHRVDPGQVDVNDDPWHAQDRIKKHVSSTARDARAGLRSIFSNVYHGLQPLNFGTTEAHAALYSMELSAKLQTWFQTFEAGLNKKVKSAVKAFRRNGKYLFFFMAHKHMLLRYGTTANENGNWSINRRFKFYTHVRPDKAYYGLLYTARLYNSKCARDCQSHSVLSDEQKRLIAGLFQPLAFIPFEAVLTGAPYIMLEMPDVRQYGVDEYEQQFGPVRPSAVQA